VTLAVEEAETQDHTGPVQLYLRIANTIGSAAGGRIHGSDGVDHTVNSGKATEISALSAGRSW